MDELHFTPRQNSIVKLLVQGKSNKEIALALSIAERTVEDHLNHIYTTLGVSSRAEAIIKLLQLETTPINEEIQAGKSTVSDGINPAVESTIADGEDIVYSDMKEQTTPKRINRIWLFILLIIGILSIGTLIVYNLNTQPWTYDREAEFPDRFTVGQDVARSNASGTKVHGQFGSLGAEPWSPQNGDVEYYNIEIPQSGDLYLQLRYSKFSVQAVRILVYLDEETIPRASIDPIDQGDWDKFIWTEWISLGEIKNGKHSIRFHTNGQEFGVADLDKFILTTEPPE